MPFDSTVVTESLAELRDEVMRRLGDTVATPTVNRVWTETEVEGYIRDGLREFSIRAQTLFEMRYLEDWPRLGNHDLIWEEDYYTTGQSIFADCGFDFPWEGGYYTGPTTTGPAYMDYPDERDSFDVTGNVPATEPLPANAYDVDRVTWDGRRIEALNTRQIRYRENNFETVEGFTFGYLQDRDGLGTIRKFRKPAGIGDYYAVVNYVGSPRGYARRLDAELAASTVRMTIDGWGIVTTSVESPLSLFHDFSPANAHGGIEDFLPTAGLLTFDEFAGDEAITRSNGESTDGWGVLKRLPGYFPANGPRGIVKRLSRDGKNMRVEYWRRGETPSNASNPIEDVPRYALRYIRHYALYRAYGKRGVGQDLRLSAHYKGRYDEGVKRTKARAEAASNAKLRRLGGSSVRGVLPGKPFPRNPRNFPE